MQWLGELLSSNLEEALYKCSWGVFEYVCVCCLGRWSMSTWATTSGPWRLPPFPRTLRRRLLYSSTLVTTWTNTSRILSDLHPPPHLVHLPTAVLRRRSPAAPSFSRGGSGRMKRSFYTWAMAPYRWAQVFFENLSSAWLVAVVPSRWGGSFVLLVLFLSLLHCTGELTRSGVFEKLSST